MKKISTSRFAAICFCAFLLAQSVSCKHGSSSHVSPLLPVEFNPTLAKALALSLDRSVQDLGIPGAVMGVRAPDGTIWTGASGHAVVQPGSPVTAMSTDLHFRIASMTKTFTATIILELVDEGRLSLGDTVNEIITKFFTPGYFNFTIPYGDTITLRNLLEMRSGMVDYGATQEFIDYTSNKPLVKLSPNEIMRMSAQSTNPLPSPPDTLFNYCNTNYVLLGIVIEQVTRNSYEWEVESRLLAPLGMSNSMVASGPMMPLPFAHGYKYVDSRLADLSEATDPSWSWAAGGILSTVGDLLLWTNTFVNKSLLSAELQQGRMKMKDGMLEVWPVKYGLGIYNDNGAIGHYGTYMGYYTSYCAHYNGYDFAVLENGELVRHTEAGRHPARSIFWNAVNDTGIAR